MTDLERAIDRAIEDICMRIRDLPQDEPLYDGVEVSKTGLQWAETIRILCEARDKVSRTTINWELAKKEREAKAAHYAAQLHRGENTNDPN